MSESPGSHSPHSDPLLDDGSPTPTSGGRHRWLWWGVGAAAGAVVLLVLAVPLGVLPPPGSWFHGSAAGAQHQLWTCAMHPQVIEDHPGKCPICGMDLVPLKKGTAAVGTEVPRPTGEEAGKRKILFYRNPMDPTITSPVPRQDEMGMDYVPVYADEAGPAAGKGAVVTIDPVVQQDMNVTTEPVRRRDIVRRIRTVGYLDYDQEKMVSVTTRYSGFVESAYINHLGQPVTKGEPLFSIYSPQLVQTQQELLSAKSYVEQMAGATPDARRRAQALFEAARTRLSYWDISAAQIDHLVASGEVLRTLTVTAPSSGVVMKRVEGLEGMEVRPGMDVIHIADLSTLWLAVEVFEDQLPWVQEGSQATVSIGYFPGETFTGRVHYVEPEVSETTRTVQLTLEVPNRGGRLRVGMYATVELAPVMARNVIAVPSDAVISTGERNVALVALGGGRFAPRELTLGAAGNGLVEVRSGLEAGDKVVTSAQFLIDSESNLQAAIQSMVEAKRAGSQGSGHAE